VQELDPDVFGEQLLEPGYEEVERIAAVGLTVRVPSGLSELGSEDNRSPGAGQI
jgi:hypothetical protein